ncbi:Flp pilus assembly protein CpaB [Janthinobacterium lividum]|uniref:Flp pilus assembly protein CpaB n=1 Tax=Janthinobacterium lividum TaxID=29581 RepID=UPI000873E1F1|nr:Flp pilus assembly protein CpaB [Janthinobacterium lividum]MCC7714175.1 Flp pilus assembly protein CpaB [Janthinobacterium lividum]OEZ47042.1 SAF domain protein [Janthinobacterium lividum]WQE27895.1 Flp pilus assembly protein CpaB [Janthinobacterium lividum]STQ98818.1 Flp pilus assembly protein CpaB [Janthinobacterium lividum]
MRNARALTMMAFAVILAFVAVIVAARWINAQASGNTNKVAVALVDISLGARIAPEMVRMVDWPSSALPPGAINDPKLLDARVTRTSIQHGEPIMESKLAPPGTQGGLSAVVGEGKRAMTVRVNDVVGVAGFALPGNYVDILVNTQDDAAKTGTGRDPSISKIVLERILVLAIAQESNRDDTKPKVVNAVTLELTPDQTEKLDLARSVGTLSLVLRNQIEDKPVNTDGATKTSLLDAKVAAQVAAPAPRPVVRRRVVQGPAGPQVDVIKGLERSSQQF